MSPPTLVMARSLHLLAAIPLLSLMVVPGLASGRYQVQQRDSFYSIARKCQVNAYELMRLNPRPGDALKLGEELRLPDNAQCGSGASSAGSTSLAYQVQPQDSFYSVARKCQVNVHELIRLNPRPDHALKLGEKLHLPGNAQCNGSHLASTVVRNVVYQVKPREGFYSIARKCQVDAQELMRLNSASGTTLQPGQQLTLPSNARCPGESATVASASTTTAPAQAAASGTISYQVKPQEGFYSIARKCKVDTRELINLNPGSASVLRPGQQLTLPSYARCPDESATVAANASTPQSTTTSTTGTQIAASTKRYYEVQPRDGFSSIARKCRVSVQALMTLNPRPGNAVLHVGDQLELPGGARCENVVAANPDASAASAATSPANSSGVTLDSGWRSYGPLKVNWQDWQMIEGHWVAKSLNRSDQPLYLAVNCPARRINQTSSNGQWSTWEVPDPGFEKQIMDDLCQEKEAQS
ncbi:MAG: hypothetical protein TH68_08070 [Candidatus Synechococcus spongiarum 142]|uniref:LysM domain-containing protein n=1 Tax=Candidatus Synechococcus spongiarum 142 TaxID=1608213 RepID=A0A6N3X2Z6_9SYNE|nr:MAG: hypothetical protein TH68_08070 [Candidatus Synechococcus spongiarum 142]